MIALLLVDDEPALLEVTRLFLERSGEITVTSAESPERAFALFKEIPFDVIVSDYEMPGMNGIEFLKVLRSAGNTIPFIIFTGKGREQIVIEALNQGADFYLQKGGDPRSQFAELEHKVKRAITQQRSEQALRQSEERFRLLAENRTDMISCHAPDGTYRYASPACVHLLGYQPEELIGHIAFDFIHPDDIPKTRECREKISTDPGKSLVTYRIRRKNGEYCWIESTSRLVDIPGQGQEIQVSSRDISARRIAEERALFQAELLDHIDQAVVVTDQNGTIVSWNRGAEVLYGWSEEQAKGKPRDTLLAALSDPNTRKRVLSTIQQGQEWNEVVPVRRSDDLMIPVRMNWWPLHNQDLQQIGAVSISEEATPSIRREQGPDRTTVLFEDEENYCSILENTTHLILSLDRQGIITHCNRQTGRYIGYTPEELIGRPLPSILSTENGEGTGGWIPEIIAENQLFSRQGVLIRKDGTVVPVRITSSGEDSRGSTTCIIMDITEQLVMERELEYHSAELERFAKGLTIQNQIISSAATLNRDQVLINACRITRDQLMFDLGGVCLLDPQKKRRVLICDSTLSPLLAERIREIDITVPPYDRAFTAGRPLCIGEGLEGAEEGIRSLVMIPLGSEGVIWGFIFLASSREPRTLTPDEQDLFGSIGTEVGRVIGTRKMQQELLASYEKTNLYLDIMTHDINNATTAALGYTECLSEMLKGREAAMAAKIRASIRQSIGIIRNVSTIRRITETERVTLPIDLDQVIKDQIAHYPGTRILYTSQSTIVAADDLIGEVLTNLIGNSRKFAGPDGTIAIRVEQNDQGYQISVEDDGPGIPDSEKPLIFNRFRKGAGEKSGRGLGLYIARMLVERYGGRIRADDRVPGSPEQGAAIRFTLPEGRDLTGCKEI